MKTSADNIASWDQDYLPSEPQFAGEDSTEAQPGEDPVWSTCVDALLKAWENTPMGDSHAPNRAAIEAAIAWIAYFRKQYPDSPPTCITPEPSGGVIVERRQQLAGGHDYLSELTFYNDGSAEMTGYFDGRIRQFSSILSRPPDVAP